MKFACHTGLLLLLVLMQACGKADAARQKAKTVDSLSGVINSMEKLLLAADTITLQKSVARFNYYKQFISQNIHDTISKNEADNLKHFYAGGAGLEAFFNNRKLVLARARQVNSQLAKLSEDIKNNAVDQEQLGRFILEEKAEADQLRETGYRQQQKFSAGFEEFKNALYGVEDLIRSRNNGTLPTIIKDSVVF